MKYRIGIFGSAEGSFDLIRPRIKQLGEILAENNVIVITGASTGLPYEVSSIAYKKGTQIWGYSSAANLKMQKQLTPSCDSSIYEKLIYIPKNYEFAKSYEVCKKYRNVASTANCDAGIIISGRWGTMNEFTNLYDMGKIIGVLIGTGGVADELPMLCQKINKKSRAKVLFYDSPKELVKNVIHELKNKST